MGVTGLWSVVQPCARPIKLETLNKKRLAVDASIWIYQFLKAVRDKEGNALRNSHVVGFFRRICKLLFFGIKPVFVFDGGAPVLKRQTVSGRKARREGRREDAVRTAGKLLAMQMQRRAEEDDRKRREEIARPATREEEEVPDEMVYVDELQMTAQERQQNRTFKKKDAYHLPDLDVSLAEMGAPNDPRIMSHEELEEYARQFHTGEDVNIYDFSKIDFNSPFFVSLPASDRYNILNAARLRSRLRMGYTKEQLDVMFPDRMAFSKFQIERATERNELTQRLMNINGMNGEDAMFGINGGGRVAGEKGKEYVLVKNDGVEGGWALGVVSNKEEGQRNKPINVDDYGQEIKDDKDEDAWEDEGFEDVPIEGLNRLPKRPDRLAGAGGHPFESDEIIKRRQALYKSRQNATGDQRQEDDELEEDHDSLFVAQENRGNNEDEDNDELFEDVIKPHEAGETEEDDELQRAIALSLEQPDDEDDFLFVDNTRASTPEETPKMNKPLEFNQKSAKAGRDFAHQTNARAHDIAPYQFAEEGDHEDHVSTDQAEPTKYMTRKHHAEPQVFGLRGNGQKAKEKIPETSPEQLLEKLSPSQPSPKPFPFDGPLPFESLNLGKSILRKKKKADSQEQAAGGFEKETEQAPVPLPPWFTGDMRDTRAAQKTFEDDLEHGKFKNDRTPNWAREPGQLKRHRTGEVIDLDAPQDSSNEAIEVESSDEGADDMQILEEAPEVRMDDVAELIREKPPTSGMPPNVPNPTTEPKRAASPEKSPSRSDSEEDIEWSESDREEDHLKGFAPNVPAGGSLEAFSSQSMAPELQELGSPKSPSPSQQKLVEQSPIPSLPTDGTTEMQVAIEEDDYSDPEDEDLMRALAVEAEEHARFASSLNAKSALQNAEEYEKELRQLRNQQKKDRRDADEVSHIMITECQQLLKLFGLPYITAPMEAEAQCAELVSLGLVDGIVTDDSDIFLFGGTRVYKNMFNQAKFVECYLTSDLEKEYSLDRQKLIGIAHLLGSDYTEGLPTVGPVTALEILSEFETLDEFTEWWSQVQMGEKPTAEDTSNPFRRKFRKNAQKIFLPNTFPDKRVDHAYLHPEVDSDPSPFQWGVPDLDALRQFLMATIGWSQERTDEVLVPVIKDINRREIEGTQANITQFFGGTTGVGGRQSGPGSSAFAPRRRAEGKSKRMETALVRLHEQARNRTMGDDEADIRREAQGTASENPKVDGATNQNNETQYVKNSRPRKRTAPTETASGTSDNDDDGSYEAPRKTKKTSKAVKKGRPRKAKE